MSSLPPPEPIDFESNPDVLAIRSALAILQMQRGRAVRDMRALEAARVAAVQDPEGFARDLAAGRVGGIGDWAGRRGARGKQQLGGLGGEGGLPGLPTADKDGEAMDVDSEGGEDSSEDEDDEEDTEGNRDGTRASNKAWATLPTPQNVVRMPPINWARYAVVGESLDRLHEEQRARPTPGQPAVLSADGRSFEYKPVPTGGGGAGGGGAGGGHGTGATMPGAGGSGAVGLGLVSLGADGGDQMGAGPGGGGAGLPPRATIAAPYAPSKDKIEPRRGKGGRK